MPSDPDPTPPVDGRILIVGGYGQVGRAIAERLAPVFPGRLAIAGRRFDKAQSATAAIGHGAEARKIDIFARNNEIALDGITLVLVCLDQSNTRFVEQCLVRGIHYVDISANNDFLSKVEKLDNLAKKNGAVALLSAGVAPGLTNMLAARVWEGMEFVDRIDILLEIGLGDHHGKTAIEWMFDNLDATYEVKENGRLKSVQSFGECIDIRLPGQRTGRATYRFNFSDQHVLGRTLDAPSVSTWIRFDDRIATWLFAKAARIGLGRLLRRPWWRKVAVWLFMNVHMGSDICGVAVRAIGRSKKGAEELTFGLIGQKEAMMTAIVAAEITRQALSSNPEPGVFHADQVIVFEQVIAALKKEIPNLVVSV